MTAPAAAKPLSARQQKVLDFIRRFWLEEHHSPSIREIQVALGLSNNVTGAIPYTLEQLEDRGLIRLARSQTGIRRMRAIVPLGDACPCCGRAS